MADTVMGGFWFILGRDPESGEKVSPSVWCLAMEGTGVWKRLLVYYTFDEKEVYVMSVLEAE